MHEAGADRTFVEQARRRIEALPGVAGTSASMRIPFGLSGSGATRKVFLPGARGGAQREGIPIHYDPVSDRFFEMLGTRLLSGRGIDARDVDTHARVLVMNQTTARRYFPGRDPIGRRCGWTRRKAESIASSASRKTASTPTSPRTGRLTSTRRWPTTTTPN